jgi:hypothetical protein
VRKPKSRLLYFGCWFTEVVGHVVAYKIAKHGNLELFNEARGDALRLNFLDLFSTYFFNMSPFLLEIMDDCINL